MATNSLTLKIISAVKMIYSGEIASVNLPGVMGSFSIYPDHAPLISALQKGMIMYYTNKEEHSLEIEGGFVEVKQGVVTVCIA